MTVGYGFAASANYAKTAVNGDFASVREQSGIQAGDGGFDIKVKGDTGLKGALIASTDKAVQDGLNRVSTGTLSVSDIENHAEARVKSSDINISSEFLNQGKYSIGKAIVGNVMDMGGASDSSSGMTRTVVSEGTVLITDEEKQKTLTGTDASMAVAMLNRNTANAHIAAQKMNLEKLEQQARTEQAIKTLATDQVFKLSDKAYKKMFVDEHPTYEVRVNDGDEKVKIDNEEKPTLVKISEAEKFDLKPGADGLVHVNTNGIFNDESAAADYAVQHNASGKGPLYLVHFPKADNPVSELMISGGLLTPAER